MYLLMVLYTKLSGNNDFSAKPNPFIDTRNPDVIKAYALGIVNGKSKTKFEPKALIKGEIATIILRTSAY